MAKKISRIEAKLRRLLINLYPEEGKEGIDEIINYIHSHSQKKEEISEIIKFYGNHASTLKEVDGNLISGLPENVDGESTF